MKDLMVFIWQSLNELIRMVYTSSDNLEIMNLLEKSGNELLFFNMDKLLFFEYEKHFYLILYSSTTRNFAQYAVVSEKFNVNGLVEMLHVIQEDENADFPLSLKAQGQKLLEHEIHSQQANRFYFDAH